MLSRVLGWVGRSMVVAGVFVLGFVAFQLWGTGVQTGRSQDELTATLAETARPASSDEPTDRPADRPAGLAEVTAALARQAPETAPPLPAPPKGSPLGVIEIPKIGLARVVVEGVSKRDLRKGPGHYPTTPLPGQPGNAAIAGHRTTYGAPFNRIDELVPGDEVVVTTRQGRFLYRVLPEPGGSGRGWFAVRPRAVEVLENSSRNLLTLTACHPKYSARQRIVVVAELATQVAPAPPPPEPADERPPPRPEVDEPSLAGDPGELAVGLAWALGAAAVGMAAWFVAHRRRRPVQWVAGLAAAPVVLALVWFSYVHLDRYLPAL